MASEISKQFSENKRHVATEPDVTRELMMRAAEMEANGFQAFKATAKGSGTIYYVLPSEKCLQENAHYKYYKSLIKREWTSFDEYISYGYQIFWVVKFSSDQWKTSSSCTCPFFLKQHICKHIITIALKEKILECPQSANPLLISARRAGGRPKNAARALMRQ